MNKVHPDPTSASAPLAGIGRMFRVVSVGFLCLLTTMSAGAEASITLAWDTNAEPGVLGYRVYVGTQSGSYSETYEVSPYQLTLVYSGVPGVRYYFAVATIGLGAVAGSRSPEVTAVEGGSNTFAVPVVAPAAAPARSTSAGPARVTCAEGGVGCYATAIVAGGLGSISDLTPTGDGRVLFVEDQRRIRMLTASGLDLRPALEGGGAVTGLALDSRFPETGAVFVGELASRADGGTELSIVRYRELGGVLGESAVVVPGLNLPEGGVAPFTVDADGMIYVALPEAPQVAGAGSPYSAHVLRFNADGTVPSGSAAGSPVFAVGFSRPSLLEWRSVGRQLWLGGSREGWPSGLAYLNAGQSAQEWPRVPTPVPAGPAAADELTVLSLAFRTVAAGGNAETLVLTESRQVYSAVLTPAGLTQVRAVPLDGFGEPMAVAAGSDGFYVAVREPATGAFAILKLTHLRGQ